MNRRTLISLIIVALIGAGIYYVVNYTDGFSKHTTYYSSFTKISGLQESGPVLMHGVKIGKVADIFLDKDRQIRVVYSIKEGITIPRGTKAKVISGDVSGTKAVTFFNGDSTGVLAAGSEIPTIPDTTMMELINTKIVPIVKGGKFLVRTADSTINDFIYLITYGGFGRQAQEQVQVFKTDLQELAATSQNASKAVDELARSLHSVEKMFGNSGEMNASVNEKLRSGVENLKPLSGKDYDSLLKQTTVTLAKLGKTITDAAEKTTLLKDRSTYVKANRMLDSANKSIQELQADPPGIQLIGGGKKK
ncbi:MAG TPA: MlaD family protein [Flavipsychrobacter sp.]|nr:MlaD family protein [Flavipsychrobacter sp.]